MFAENLFLFLPSAAGMIVGQTQLTYGLFAALSTISALSAISAVSACGYLLLLPRRRSCGASGWHWHSCTAGWRSGITAASRRRKSSTRRRKTSWTQIT
jgi:hypothetical protein